MSFGRSRPSSSRGAKCTRCSKAHAVPTFSCSEARRRTGVCPGSTWCAAGGQPHTRAQTRPTPTVFWVPGAACNVKLNVNLQECFVRWVCLHFRWQHPWTTPNRSMPQPEAKPARASQHPAGAAPHGSAPEPGAGSDFGCSSRWAGAAGWRPRGGGAARPARGVAQQRFAASGATFWPLYAQELYDDAALPPPIFHRPTF